MISQVPLCGEPQAARRRRAPAASQIGHTVVEAGPGPYPLVVPQPGRAARADLLDGPYEGAPFGLSIVVPVIAGPFNLGTIVTRASIAVDPHTAQLTVTTDPLPQIVDGIPTDLRTINAVIDRPEFMFNPTNCSPMAFSGTATSTRRRERPDLEPLPGRFVSQLDVQTGLQSLDVGEDLQSGRCEPRREGRLSDGRRWAQTRPARSRTSRASRSTCRSNCRRG